jgi:NhaP-type Na+/H+ or K+/H+ antiporter
MILSPSILGIFHEELVGEDLAIITDVALGIIAFSIGGALELSKIRRLGKQIFWITVTQAFGAFLMVTGVIALFFPMIAGSQSALLTNYAPLAIVVGAISAATAPAATLGVIHEYRASGPLTTVLLGVVTLDDALTILFFAFAVKLAGSLITGEALSLMGILAGDNHSAWPRRFGRSLSQETRASDHHSWLIAGCGIGDCLSHRRGGNKLSFIGASCQYDVGFHGGQFRSTQ